MIESNKENKGGNSIENSFASGVSVQSVQDLNCKTKKLLRMFSCLLF